MNPQTVELIIRLQAISLEMEKYNHDTEQTERKFTEMKSNARSQLIHNQQKESQLKVTQVSLSLLLSILFFHWRVSIVSIHLGKIWLLRNGKSVTICQC